LQNQEAILVLQKRIYQIQTDLGTAQTQFAETTEKLNQPSAHCREYYTAAQGWKNLGFFRFLGF